MSALARKATLAILLQMRRTANPGVLQAQRHRLPDVFPQTH
jgi:hypothetical protein